jgi:hypothetical protein
MHGGVAALGGAALAALVLPATGCTRPRTEIVVVVDTDLTVPQQLSGIAIEVTDPSDETARSLAQLEDAGDLPATLGLVREGGPLGPFTVRVIGMRGSRQAVERLSRVHFEVDTTLALPMHLLRRCLGVDCEGDTTCAEEGCRAVDAAEGELEPWDGQPPRLAGSDGDGDVDSDAEPDEPEGCSADEVPWQGICEARQSLALCPNRCADLTCRAYYDLACLDIDGESLCVGWDGGPDWVPCGPGW